MECKIRKEYIFMKKLRLLMVAAVVMLTTVLMTIPVFATGEASFSIPDGAVDSGENFNVSLTFYATEKIGSVQAEMAYDNNSVQFISGDNASGGNGIVVLKGSVGNTDEVTYNMTFKGLKAGSSTMNLVSCSILSQNGSNIGSPTAYASVTVGEDTKVTEATKEPTETTTTEKQTSEQTTPSETSIQNVVNENEVPSQGVLTSLTVDNGTLSPEFSWNVHDYVVNVGYDVTNVELEGTTASQSDYIWYTGTSECQVGENVRTITVTDVNGNQTKYTITIIRANEGETQKTVTAQTEINNKESDSTSKVDTFEQFRKTLTPVLIIVLIVLIIALIVVVFWIRTKVLGEFKKNKKKK